MQRVRAERFVTIEYRHTLFVTNNNKKIVKLKYIFANPHQTLEFIFFSLHQLIFILLYVLK